MVIMFGGIDFPVFEMLLFVSVLQIIGFVFVIIAIVFMFREIRGLRKLIVMEGEDIKRFEKDIEALEKYEGKRNVVSKKLTQYIRDNLAKGFKWPQIKMQLMENNWDENILEQAYQEFKDSD